MQDMPLVALSENVLYMWMRACLGAHQRCKQAVHCCHHQKMSCKCGCAPASAHIKDVSKLCIAISINVECQPRPTLEEVASATLSKMSLRSM